MIQYLSVFEGFKSGVNAVAAPSLGHTYVSRASRCRHSDDGSDAMPWDVVVPKITLDCSTPSSMIIFIVLHKPSGNLFLDSTTFSNLPSAIPHSHRSRSTFHHLLTFSLRNTVPTLLHPGWAQLSTSLYSPFIY